MGRGGAGVGGSLGLVLSFLGTSKLHIGDKEWMHVSTPGFSTLDNCLPLYPFPKSWIHYVIIFHDSNKQDDGSSIL